MELFIRGLPANTNRNELRQFVLDGLRWRRLWPFGAKPQLVSWHILKFTHEELNRVELHGLIDIQPDKAARAAINILNGRDFGGVPVEVSEYEKRSTVPEKRHEETPILKNMGDRRRGERRRDELKAEKIIGANATVRLDKEKE